MTSYLTLFYRYAGVFLVGVIFLFINVFGLQRWDPNILPRTNIYGILALTMTVVPWLYIALQYYGTEQYKTLWSRYWLWGAMLVNMHMLSSDLGTGLMFVHLDALWALPIVWGGSILVVLLKNSNALDRYQHNLQWGTVFLVFAIAQSVYSHVAPLLGLALFGVSGITVLFGLLAFLWFFLVFKCCKTKNVSPLEILDLNQVAGEKSKP